jgi:hypothetical protein
MHAESRGAGLAHSCALCDSFLQNFNVMQERHNGMTKRHWISNWPFSTMAAFGQNAWSVHVIPTAVRIVVAIRPVVSE